MDLLGRILLERNDCQEGETWLLRAVDGGHHPFAAAELGDLCRDRGDLAGAEAWWRRATLPVPAKNFPGHVSAMYRLGALLADRGDVKEAEAWLELAAGYGNKPAMALLAEFRERRGDLIGARLWQQRATGNGYFRQPGVPVNS